MSKRQRPAQQIVILQSSKIPGEKDMKDRMQEDRVGLGEEETAVEQIVDDVIEDGDVDPEGDLRRIQPNYGARKRLMERNEERRQEVGEPPMYADVPLGFDDIETLLLYPETIAADKVGFTVPSGTQMSDAT